MGEHRVVSGIWGVFLSGFEYFRVFFKMVLSVFEPKKTSLSYLKEAPKGFLAKKTGFWSIFWPKNNMAQIILGTIAGLLAVFWSMTSVKTKKCAFWMP